MRYILDDLGYIEEVSFGGMILCNNKTCTEYTGAIPEGYTSLIDWVDKANIRAYKIVSGHLTLDSARDIELKAQWEQTDGYTSVIGKASKNLFRLNNKGVTSNGLTSVIKNNNVKTTGTSNTSTWANITNRVYDNLPAGTYTFSVDKTRSAARITLRVYTSETEYQNFEMKENELSKTFTIGSNIVSYYLYFWNLTNGNSYDFDLNFQLEKSSNASEYEEYYEPTILIGSSNEIGITNNKKNDSSLLFDTSERITITPKNGTNHANYGGSYYYKVGTKVHLHLGVGGLTANTTYDIVTLPAGYRPNHILGAYGLSNNMASTCSMQISAGGIVSVRPSSTYALVDFEFDAVQ